MDVNILKSIKLNFKYDGAQATTKRYKYSHTALFVLDLDGS